MSVRAEPRGREGTAGRARPGGHRTGDPVCPAGRCHTHTAGHLSPELRLPPLPWDEMLPALPPSMLLPGIVHGLDFTVEKSLRTSSNCWAAIEAKVVFMP